jgi:hypothetical protein
MRIGTTTEIGVIMELDMDMDADMAMLTEPVTILI